LRFIFIHSDEIILTASHIHYTQSRLHLDWNNNEYRNSVITNKDILRDGISLLATAVLAIDDFNRKKSVLVADLEESYGTCSKLFSEVRLIDTLRDASHVLSEKEKWSDSCAIVGIQDNQVARAVAEDDRGIPSLSYGAWSDDLSGSSASNLILGTATWQARMDALVTYLKVRGVKRAALLYAPGNETQMYFEAFQKAADGNDLQVFDAPSLRSKTDLESTLLRLRKNNVGTIIVGLERDDRIGVLAGVAEKLNMHSIEFSWIFLDSFLSPQYVDRYETPFTSALGRLFLRSTIFQVLDPLAPRMEIRYEDPDSDKKRSTVLEEMGGRVDLTDTVNELLREMTRTTDISINKDFFDDVRRPAYGAGFVYDSIIATGIAACNGLEKGSDAFGQVDFEGVTGGYHFQDGARVSNAVQFGIYVVRQVEFTDSYIAVLQDRTVGGEWVLQDPYNDQNILQYASTLGFTLAGISFIFCLGSATFIVRNRTNVIITLGQPIFLLIVCFGSSLFSISIVFQSFDDMNIQNMRALDIFCMLQVWIAYVGQITVYMALFSKVSPVFASKLPGWFGLVWFGLVCSLIVAYSYGE
jgi:hypothetical protein